MRPRARLSLAGCAALAALALALAGCGGGDSATTEPAGAKRRAASGAPATAASPAAAGRACPSRLTGFVDSLDALRRRLVAGLTYEQYVGAVKRLRVEYAAIPVATMPAACLLGAGTPSERAFDLYVEAANAWGECLSEPGCRGADVETTLQRRWHLAAASLRVARSGLVAGD